MPPLQGSPLAGRAGKGAAENPTFSVCCCKGEVSFLKLPRLPAEQEEYWLGETGAAKHFRRNARASNSVLAFTSQGAKIELPFLGDVQVLRINGAAFHRLGPLILKRRVSTQLRPASHHAQ